MASKELVEICSETYTCSACKYVKECQLYQIQFKCFPFDVISGYKTPQEANSDVEIEFI